uniref:hypothetical protein n=1 Tax=Daedalea confragosa TaxID=2028083 RepID=UPI002A7F98FD|nr:hypothetical protein UYH48_mgp04 [Daedaleopsis confragosa]WNZ34418.1 hypothetical protein [Daedaleopsis confragosa]
MNVILFQFLTLCSINIILASCLVYYSNKGIFGKFFRDMFKYDNKFEYIALLITSCIVLNMIYSIINIYILDDSLRITDEINKIIINSRRGNSFIEISSDVLNNVDTDIIINYGGIILIVWGLIGIFTMYLGNYLIEKFELKGRYYWLDKIIDIRTKIFPYFVKYEIFWIITILLIMIIYNLI